tara:strand:+ start:938 stop:2344 length:1407 start_codon:yes stop_codon:yes gene_type:complete
MATTALLLLATATATTAPLSASIDSDIADLDVLIHEMESSDGIAYSHYANSNGQGKDLGFLTLTAEQRPWSSGQCALPCSKRAGCAAWTFAVDRCYFKAAPSGVGADPFSLSEASGVHTGVLKHSAVYDTLYAKAHQYETSTCREFAAPFPSSRWRSPTMDAAERAWELRRERSNGMGDLDLVERRMHFFALMSPHSRMPFGAVPGVDEADAWKRFDFDKCCSEVDMYMHRIEHENVGNNGGRGKCPGNNWEVCGDGKGAWEFGFHTRWGGTDMYDQFFLKAFDSRTAAAATASSSPTDFAAARAGTYGGTGVEPDPVLPAKLLLPIFPSLPVDAHSHIRSPRSTKGSSARTAQFATNACVQLLEHTPMSVFPTEDQKRMHPHVAPGDAFVGEWLKAVFVSSPDARPESKGSGWVVNNCFVDTTWGEDFCKNFDASCTRGAMFQHWDAMLHKSSMHCRGYRPFYDGAC